MRRIETTKIKLSDAETLARFSNAADRDAIEKFRASNERYFPPSFWAHADLPVPGELFFGVDLSSPLRALGLSGERNSEEPRTVPYWWGLQQGVRRAWETEFSLDWCVMLVSLAHNETPVRAWPYQRAVVFLGMEPWRARFCGMCGKRFVADKPARRFCSTVCTGKARKASRDSWWDGHGAQWREKRTGRKSSRRTKQ